MLTFLFTDIEGSTRLWELSPAAMSEDLEQHDLLLVETVRDHGGEVFKLLGDGVAAVFQQPDRAVAAAVVAQRRLHGTAWRTGQLRSRMGLHAGPALPRDGDWFGPTVNRAARLHAVAHGGQIVVSAAVLAEVGERLPERAAVRDLGEHRLRDLGEPERIFQVEAPGLPRAFPPLRTEQHPIRGVPIPPTRLVGRGAQLEQLTEAVSANPLVTLVGAPGAGKTRLVVELVRRRHEPWTGGVWFCSLASLASSGQGAEQVGALVGDLVGAFAAESSSVLSAIASAFAERPALIVLDGCDRVLDEVATLAEGIAATCENVTILATSRERLGVVGECVVELPVLDASSALELLAERCESLGVTSGPADHDHLADLVAALDGLPLAIELAAAHLRTRSVPEVIAGLSAWSTRSVPSRSTRASGPSHHETMEAAIAWSLERLDPAARELFAALGVFSGSFTTDDVRAIAADRDPSDVDRDLQSLLEASLVSRRPSTDATRGSHYRLLHTLRRDAAQRLRNLPDGVVVRQRWADSVIDTVHLAAGRLPGPDEARWVGRLRDQWPDVRSLLEDAVADASTDLAVRLVAPLVHHSTMRGVEVGGWAVRCCDLPGFWDHPDAPRVASMASELLLRTGNLQRATELAERAVARSAELGEDGQGSWLAHSTLALVALAGGDLAIGMTRMQGLLAVTDRLLGAEPMAPAVSSFLLATVMAHAGSPEMGEPAVSRLEEIGAATDAPSILSMAFLARGRLTHDTDPSSASRCYVEALELAQSVDNLLIATQARWAIADLSALSEPRAALADLAVVLDDLQVGDDAQQQQTLLAALAPLVALEADDPALLIAATLRDTVWARSVRYRTATERLYGRVGGPSVDAAIRRVQLLGSARVRSSVVAAIGELTAHGE